MAKRKPKNKPAETIGDSGFVIEPESNAVVVRVPVKFYRRNGRQMILAKDDASGVNCQTAPGTNGILAVTLAKAWMWQEQLESGEYSTLEELGNANGVDRTYVGRILRLTSLSPELVELVLSGNDGENGTSLRQFHKGIPLFWDKQIKMRELAPDAV